MQSKGTGFIAGIAFASAVIAGSIFCILRFVFTANGESGSFRNRYFTLGTVSSLLNFASQYILVFLTPFTCSGLSVHTDKIGLLMTCFPFAVMVVAPFSGALPTGWGLGNWLFPERRFCRGPASDGILACRCLCLGGGMAACLIWFGHWDVPVPE